MRLIDGDYAKEILVHDYSYEVGKMLLEEVPTIDPETLPIVQELRKELKTRDTWIYAQWGYTDYDGELSYAECTNCGKKCYTEGYFYDLNEVCNFCPYCGANMGFDYDCETCKWFEDSTRKCLNENCYAFSEVVGCGRACKSWQGKDEK